MFICKKVCADIRKRVEIKEGLEKISAAARK